MLFQEEAVQFALEKHVECQSYKVRSAEIKFDLKKLKASTDTDTVEIIECFDSSIDTRKQQIMKVYLLSGPYGAKIFCNSYLGYDNLPSPDVDFMSFLLKKTGTESRYKLELFPTSGESSLVSEEFSSDKSCILDPVDIDKKTISKKYCEDVALF